RGVAVYQRQHEGQTAVIAINASHRRRTVTIPAQFTGSLPEQLAAAGSDEPLAAGASVQINGRSARIWAD
ncbi:MAG: hypothetical protein WBO48_21780, partial [Candidatus Promineifilaceae bacterium]